MEAATKVFLLRMKSKAMVHTVGQMENHTRGLGTRTKCRGRESSAGKMESDTKALLLKIGERARASLSGQTAARISATGKMENSTASELS